MSKFAAALKEQAGSPVVSPIATPAPGMPAAARSGARTDTKHISGYFAPEVSKQLRALAVAEDTTVQDLLAEALNILFQSRRQPTIAAVSRGQSVGKGAEQRGATLCLHRLQRRDLRCHSGELHRVLLSYCGKALRGMLLQIIVKKCPHQLSCLIVF